MRGPLTLSGYVVLAALTLSTSLASQGGFVEVEGFFPTVTRDGSLVLAAKGQPVTPAIATSLSATALPLGGGVPLLITAEGCVWSRSGDHRILARRGDRRLHDFELPSRPFSVAEDGQGNVWFLCRDAAFWFDGSELHTRLLDPLVGRSWDGAMLDRSEDGSRLFLWSRGAPGFDVIAGSPPVLTRVDVTRGLPFRTVEDLHVTRGAGVVTMPGLAPLTPRDWGRVRPPSASALQNRPPEVTTVLGQFEVDRFEILPSDDGRVWVKTTSALRYVEGTLPRQRPRSKWTRQSPQHLETGALSLLPVGDSILLIRDPDGHVHRAAPEVEAFGPTMVDAQGTPWRFRSKPGHGRSLSALKNGESWTMVHRATGQATKLLDGHSVDHKAHAVVRVSLGEERDRSFDPADHRHIVACLDGTTLPEHPDFAWSKAPVEVWTPEREDLAWNAAKAAILLQDSPRLWQVVHHYAGVARLRPGLLKHEAAWSEAARRLGIGASEHHRFPSTAIGSAAFLLGMTEEARSQLESSTARAWESKDVPAMAKAAETSLKCGFDDLALVGFEHALAYVDPSWNHQVSAWMQAALDAALRLGRYSDAHQHGTDLMERDHSSIARTRRRHLEAIERVLASPGNLAEEIRCIEIVWLMSPVGRGRDAYGHATRALLRLRHDSTLAPGDRLALLQLLQEVSRRSRDRDAAQRWANEIIKSCPGEREAHASALLKVAEWVPNGLMSRDMLARRWIVSEYPETRAALAARYDVGRSLLDRGEAEAALEFLLPLTTDTRTGSRAWQKEAAASRCSEAYEALGNLKAALRYAELAEELRLAQLEPGHDHPAQPKQRERLERLRERLRPKEAR